MQLHRSSLTRDRLLYQIAAAVVTERHCACETNPPDAWLCVHGVKNEHAFTAAAFNAVLGGEVVRSGFCTFERMKSNPCLVLHMSIRIRLKRDADSEHESDSIWGRATAGCRAIVLQEEEFAPFCRFVASFEAGMRQEAGNRANVS